MLNALPAGASSWAVENLRSFAEIWSAFGSTDAGGPDEAGAAAPEEQAAAARTMAARPSAAVTCFTDRILSGRDAGAGWSAWVRARGPRVAIPASVGRVRRRTARLRAEPGRCRWRPR